MPESIEMLFSSEEKTDILIRRKLFREWNWVMLYVENVTHEIQL